MRPDEPPRVADPERLAALHRTGLLDSPREPAFDRLTRLASRVLRVPVSLVSLVDADRQFFKSATGLAEPWDAARETPLTHSFCRTVVERAAPVIVEDARAEPAFRDNRAITELGVVAYAGVPLVTNDGQPLGAFCAIDSQPRQWTPDDLEILRELTALVMTEVRLREALLRADDEAEAAKRATRVRDDMLSVVSHDLRNPIHTITMGASLLDELLPKDAPARSQVGVIHRAARRADRLIQDLLDVARLDSGRLVLDARPHDAWTILLEAAELVRARAGERRLTLDLLRPDEPLFVLADRDRVVQVLDNLLGNAVKFTPPGGRITAGASLVESGVCFYVTDTGVGITADQQSHLFERFWQAKRGDRRGVGLGLSIALGLVAAHGGRMWVESDEGKGSTFQFVLPRAEVAPREPVAEPARALSPPTP